MMNKKVIGIKSYKFILLELIGFILGLTFFVLSLYGYFEKSYSFCLLLSILILPCIIITIYLLIKSLIRPKNIVEVDEKGVYLNFTKRRIKYIFFQDIDSVNGDRITSKRVNYKFGNLFLISKGKRYKIGVVNNIIEIEKYIYSKIKYKFNY